SIKKVITPTTPNIFPKTLLNWSIWIFCGLYPSVAVTDSFAVAIGARHGILDAALSVFIHMWIIENKVYMHHTLNLESMIILVDVISQLCSPFLKFNLGFNMTKILDLNKYKLNVPYILLYNYFLKKLEDNYHTKEVNQEKIYMKILYHMKQSILF
ncbi:hypothetical protein ACJX0J_036874, partial [Zea mays]